MSSIMDTIIIGPELSELFALEFAKNAESDCLHPSIYKCRPNSTKQVTIYTENNLHLANYESQDSHI